MTATEKNDFYRQQDDDKQPCLPEPPELIDSDWEHVGDME